MINICMAKWRNNLNEKQTLQKQQYLQMCTILFENVELFTARQRDALVGMQRRLKRNQLDELTLKRIDGLVRYAQKRQAVDK